MITNQQTDAQHSTLYAGPAGQHGSGTMSTSAMQISMSAPMDGGSVGGGVITALLDTNSLHATNDHMLLGKRHVNMNELTARVKLDDRELWTRFQNLTNEMIVTKNGR